MVALIITVLLVTIITSMLAKNSYTNLNLKKLTRLENDIDMLIMAEYNARFLFLIISFFPSNLFLNKFCII